MQFAAKPRTNIIIWENNNTLFICSAALLNHYIDANPAKFNTLCLLPWIWDTEQTTKSVAEKQQRSFFVFFRCQIASVSGTLYPPQHEAQSEI